MCHCCQSIVWVIDPLRKNAVEESEDHRKTEKNHFEWKRAILRRHQGNEVCRGMHRRAPRVLYSGCNDWAKNTEELNLMGGCTATTADVIKCIPVTYTNLSLLNPDHSPLSHYRVQ